MIYRANNNPLVLTEDAADSFLESVGVELFEDSIGINGTIYEGAYGESILEANGIFLYEDCIVLELKYTKQIEDYLDNKTKQFIRRSVDEDNRNKRRYGTTSTYVAGRHKTGMNTKHGKDKDELRYFRSSRIVDEHKKKIGQWPNTINKNDTIDAVNRHMRRHPKQYDNNGNRISTNESTIFSDIEII